MRYWFRFIWFRIAYVWKHWKLPPSLDEVEKMLTQKLKDAKEERKRR